MTKNLNDLDQRDMEDLKPHPSPQEEALDTMPTSYCYPNTSANMELFVSVVNDPTDIYGQREQVPEISTTNDLRMIFAVKKDFPFFRTTGV